MRRPNIALILALAAVLAVPTAARAASDAADVPASPLDLTSASLTQQGTDLVFTVHTRGEWASRALSGRGRALCLLLTQGSRKYVCATATGSGRPALSLTPAGGTTSGLSATIKRPDLKTFSARFTVASVGLRPAAFHWFVTSTWADRARCGPGQPSCGDRLPDTGSISGTVLPPVPTGCQAHSPWSVSNASRSRRVVAMTFDDGPSSYTHQVLDILKRNRIHATFFVIGNQVAGRGDVMRRALREGNAIGNHSWNHADLSGGAGGQLTSTQAAIRRATGYTPCVFRPPYGATSSLLVSQARALGLATIIWDVDPRDWSRPGTDAIYSNIVANTHPGSIILDHDGGGPREQTVAALPRVIATLKRRGYRFETVPELLGFRPKYN